MQYLTQWRLRVAADYLATAIGRSNSLPKARFSDRRRRSPVLSSASSAIRRLSGGEIEPTLVPPARASLATAFPCQRQAVRRSAALATTPSAAALSSGQVVQGGIRGRRCVAGAVNVHFGIVISARSMAEVGPLSAARTSLVRSYTAAQSCWGRRSPGRRSSSSTRSCSFLHRRVGILYSARDSRHLAA
jgi:hypothetical protein